MRSDVKYGRRMGQMLDGGCPGAGMDYFYCAIRASRVSRRCRIGVSSDLGDESGGGGINGICICGWHNNVALG